MDELERLCKERGFVFKSSEIYGGIAGFFDYGPLGVELQNNIKQHWWRHFVSCREDMVGLNSSIIHSPEVWKASGHVAGFSDPLCECKTTKKRFRADHLLFAKVSTNSTQDVGYVCLIEPESDVQGAFEKAAKELVKSKKVPGDLLTPLEVKEVADATADEMELIPSPASGVPGDLTIPRAFNMMFTTQVGAVTDSSATAYLRPETAQGIFVNFKNVQTVSRQKVPFGIAQIGKAFRNEITPRQFLFRSREFEQMEIEYFCKPGEETMRTTHAQWLQDVKEWVVSIGVREDLLDFEVHEEDKLAHYAKMCTDITFKYPFGQQELLGIAARGQFDLEQHQTASKESLEYFDDRSKCKFLPWVIEPSIGVDRLFLAVMASAYDVDEVDGEKRKVLRFKPCLAPIKVAVFPLLKNDEDLLKLAREIHRKLLKRYQVFWDVSGSIGKRYRRMDEAGTPFCVTVDKGSLEDGMVTVRDRDSTRQIRMLVSNLYGYLADALED
jgi:glycyl-tRNA synthetase